MSTACNAFIKRGEGKQVQMLKSSLVMMPFQCGMGGASTDLNTLELHAHNNHWPCQCQDYSLATCQVLLTQHKIIGIYSINLQLSVFRIMVLKVGLRESMRHYKGVQDFSNFITVVEITTQHYQLL